MQLRKLVLGLGLATLMFAFAPAVGAEPAAGPSGEVVAPVTLLPGCATSSLPEILAEAQVCGDSELPSIEQDLFGTPTPTWLSCSGDDCGCYEPPCSEECDVGDEQCMQGCRQGQIHCAVCCCCPCPYCPGYCGC